MTAFTAHLKVFLALVLSLQGIFGLKCYDCNSGHDKDCQVSPIPEKYLKECNPEMLSIYQTTSPSASPTADTQAVPTTGENNSSVSGQVAPVAPPSPDANSQSNHHASRHEQSVSAGKNASEFTVVPNIPKEATFCRKISNHIPEQINGGASRLPKHTRVIRNCGFNPEEKKSEDRANSNSGCKWLAVEGVQVEQCICDGDGCNAGHYVGSLSTQTLILLSLITAGYFYIL